MEELNKKREEIREGIAKYLLSIHPEKGGCHWENISPFAQVVFLDQALAIMEFSHSAGCVLKVERWLPGCGCEICDAENGVMRMRVEPLIAEGRSET